MSGEVWSTDVRVSRPVPPDGDVFVDFGGTGMTANGLAHSITDSDVEEIFTPYYGPVGHQPGGPRSSH